MAQISTFDPSSSEARSPLIAGLTEAVNKISIILDMQTTVYEETTMLSVYIDTKLENRNRIYQVEMGKRLWISSPNPIIRKNGSIINSATDFFEIDYIGGSIAFQDGHNLLNTDIVTATITSVNDKSKVIYDIINDISLLKTKANHDKGFFATQAALIAAHPTGVNGDNAIVGDTDTTWVWDSDLSKWADTHKATDLSNYYTKPAVDNLLNTKEPTISIKGETLDDDNYYYGGRKQWIDLIYKIKNTVLTGIDVTAIGIVSEVDNIISALGKLQSQSTAMSTKVTQEIADREQGDIDTLTTANSAGEAMMNAHNVSGNAHADRFELKADKVTTYTKDEIDANTYRRTAIDSYFVATNAEIALKADTTTVYTKGEVDTALGFKANQTAVTNSLGLKADKTKMPTISLFSIGTALFVADIEYSDYPLRASVAISGVVLADSVDMNFNIASLTIANLAEVASVCKSYNGGVYLYAKTMPTGTMSGTATITKG